MPNTPARLGKGMTVWYATPETTDDAARPGRRAARRAGRTSSRSTTRRWSRWPPRSAAPARPTSSSSWRRSSTPPSTSASRATSPTTSSSRRSRARRSSRSSPACTRPSCATWSPRPGGTSAAALHELESGPAADRAVRGGLGGLPADRRARRPARGAASSAPGKDRRGPETVDDGRRARSTHVAVDLRRAPLADAPRRRPARPRARPVGRRGGALGPARRDVGRPRRRRLAPARRGAVGRRRPGLVAGRARRPRRRLAGARDRLHRDRASRPAAGRPTTTTTAATSIATTSAAARRGRRCRPTRSLARLAAARPRLLGGRRAARRRHDPRRRRLGLGVHRPCTATTSTTSRSSSRGPTTLRARQVDGDPFVADPRAADHAGFRGPGRGRSRPTFDALLRTVPARRWTVGEVTPGWTLRDHVGHLADWADGRRPRDRGLPPRRRRGWPTRTRASTPGTSGMVAAARGRDAGSRRWRATTRPRAALLRGRRHDRHRGAPLAGRLELGLRLPARPRPQAPRDARSVVRDRGDWPDADGRLIAAGVVDAAPAGLTIEAIVAVESPREFRLHPRDRVVAYTAEAGGARQLFTLSLRGRDAATQLTASEKPVGDPQWSPDGRRLAFVRDDEIWVVEADGSRLDPGRRQARRRRASRAGRPTGSRLAFLSRRRGWSQVWLIDAPVPAPRPAAANEPKPPEPTALTASGIDVDAFAWSPDGERLAVMAQAVGRRTSRRRRSRSSTSRPARPRSSPASDSHDTGARWLPDGSLLYVSDADGWFQVVRRTADGRDRIVLTGGEREHGEPSGGLGLRAAAVAGRQPLRPHRGPRRPDRPRRRRPGGGRRRSAAAAGRRRRRGPWPRPTTGRRIKPWDGVWRAVGWLPDGAWVAAIGESETRPQDLWLLPVPGVAPDGARPRQVTDSRPAVLGAALAPGRVPAGERIAFTARDGLRIEGTLWRPTAATGKRGGQRVPTIVYPHGGPTWQAYRSFQPFKLLLARGGLRVPRRRLPRLDRLRPRVPPGQPRRVGPRRRPRRHRAARSGPRSSRGRTAGWRSTAGRTAATWSCAPSSRSRRCGAPGSTCTATRRSPRATATATGVGRLDLLQMMGSPDEPGAAERYRRGSPVYRAERIEAPLLILHGRKDKRVVPLMTERMVEALEIEGKTHEVHWYDDEGHGWERRENRRDAFERILAFLRTHVLDEPPGPSSGRTARVLALVVGGAWAGALSSRGITLIEPSVSRTASRTSSTGRGRARGPRSARPRHRAFSSRRAFSQEPAVADQQPRLALDHLAHARRSALSEARARSRAPAASARRPDRPTPSCSRRPSSSGPRREMTRMTISSRIDIWPTSRLPESRSTTTRNR